MPEVAVYTSNSRGELETLKKFSDDLRELANFRTISYRYKSHCIHPACEAGEGSVSHQKCDGQIPGADTVTSRRQLSARYTNNDGSQRREQDGMRHRRLHDHDLKTSR